MSKMVFRLKKQNPYKHSVILFVVTLFSLYFFAVSNTSSADQNFPDEASQCCLDVTRHAGIKNKSFVEAYSYGCSIPEHAYKNGQEFLHTDEKSECNVACIIVFGVFGSQKTFCMDGCATYIKNTRSGALSRVIKSCN